MHGPIAGIVCLLSPAQYSLCVYISYVKGIYNIQSSRAVKLQYINIFATYTFGIYKPKWKSFITFHLELQLK